MILVTGDVVLDQNIYEGKRLKPDAAIGEGTLYSTQEGGARLIWGVLNELAPRSVLFGLKTPPPEEFPDSFRKSAVWESAPTDMSDDRRAHWSLARNLGYGCKERIPWPFTPQNQLARINAEIAVIDDGAVGFREARRCWPPFVTGAGPKVPNVRWIVLNTAPPFADGALWQNLTDRWKDKLLVIVSVDDLRNENARIACGLSWETTVDDILDALNQNPAIRELQSCRHLIVTLRGDAALWIQEPRDPAQWRCRLIFDRERCEGQWEDESKRRDAYGFSSVFAASIAWGLEKLKNRNNPDLMPAIGAGLSATRFLRLWGHGPACEQPAFPFAEIAQHLRNETDAHHGPTIHSYAAARLAREKSGGRDWSLLRQISPWSLDAPARRLALFGSDSLVNAPCARFGDLQTMDRREIDSLRSIRQLMLTYKNHDPQERPLCLAVFGAPGSGKSFGLKRIAKGVFGSDNPVLEFNLSQFPDPRELAGAFHQIRDHVVSAATPVVFWDEFDTENLKWLPYFLAPMQDGAFQEGQLRHAMGKCVFIFAGGTARTFSEFRSRETENNEHFVQAKGPDFVSRIIGFLDIAGPNQRKQKVAATGKSDYDPTDIEFPVRRAMTIRVALKLGNRKLQMDSALLAAFLRIGEYQNGARSLANLLAYMSARGGGTIRQADLPPDDVLELYVKNVSQFNSLISEHTKLASVAEKIAPLIHQDYCESLTEKQRQRSASYVRWSRLPEDLRDSNRLAAMRMPEILALAGLGLEEGRNSDAENQAIRRVLKDNIEKLTEAEHDAWEEEKLIKGWSYGDIRRDAAQRHDLLKPYALLSEEQKNRDRKAIMHYSKNARKAGLKIVGIGKGGAVR